jgi:hypothetical protein
MTCSFSDILGICDFLDREMGAWDPKLPNICPKGDISDSDLMQLRTFRLVGFRSFVYVERLSNTV